MMLFFADTMYCYLHAPSGLCIGVGSASLLPYSGASGAKRVCQNSFTAGVFMPNTEDKWNFVKNLGLFNDLTLV